MKNHNDALILNIAFYDGKNQEIEDTNNFQKLGKIAVTMTITLVISSLFSLPGYYVNKNNPVNSGVFITGIAGIYGTTTAWFLVRLEREFFLHQHFNQKLSKEGKIFKAMKHFFSIALSIIPNGFLLYVAAHEKGFLQQETAVMNLFRYSFYFMCGYYYFFNSKNKLMSFITNEADKSVKITHAFCKIIDSAIPTLLRLSKSEREGVLSAVYSPEEKDKISLPVLLKELRMLSKEEDNASKYFSYESIKKVSAFLSIAFSIIFMAVDFKVPGYSVITNSKSMIIFSTITRLPPYFLMDVLIVNAAFNQVLTNIYHRECDDIVAYFFPKLSYAIAGCSTVLFLIFIAFSIQVDSTSDRYENPTNLGSNYFSDILSFVEDFLFIHVTFNEVYKLLINNYIQIFGQEEKKDLFRLANFLYQIKNILYRARPDVMNEIFTNATGDTLLINLGVRRPEVSDEKSLSITFSSFSANPQGMFAGTDRNSHAQKAGDSENRVVHNQLIRLAHIGEYRDSYGSNP